MLENPYFDWIYCVAVLPTGELVCDTDEYAIKIWGVKKKKAYIKKLFGHTWPVTCISVFIC